MEQQSGVAPGTILAGKYRVDRVLGAGGMGVVVAAHHLHLDERVAIKMLLPEMLSHGEAVERFTREARAAVKIKSEYVARVSDVGSLENGAPYMVMEYLEGEDLGEWVANKGPLPVEQAVEFVLQACEALAEAHSLGIVHRDIKPANLFCLRRSDGLLAVKVLDFGISKVGGSGDMGMTKTSTVMGSPYYMSPEQMVSAKKADAQSDIWSLGAVLFELLSGRVPFQAETLPELVIKVTSTPAPDLAELRSDVPPGLRAVVQRCLERDKSQRYQNIAELAAALCEYGPDRAHASAHRASRVLQAAGLTQGLPPVTQPSASAIAQVTAQPTASGGDTVAAFGHTAPSLSPPNRTGLYAALAGVSIVGIGAALLLLSGGQDSPPTEDPGLHGGSPVAGEMPEGQGHPGSKSGGPSQVADVSTAEIPPPAATPNEANSAPSDTTPTTEAPSQPAEPATPTPVNTAPPPQPASSPKAPASKPTTSKPVTKAKTEPEPAPSPPKSSFGGRL